MDLAYAARSRRRIKKEERGGGGKGKRKGGKGDEDCAKYGIFGLLVRRCAHQRGKRREEKRKSVTCKASSLSRLHPKPIILVSQEEKRKGGEGGGGRRGNEG